jgi:hypothetical protein
MARKLIGTVTFVLSIWAIGLGQSAFQDITPGASTRNEVENALGQPVRTIGANVFEYKAPAGIAKVEVRYDGSSVVERLEVYFLKPISRSALLQKYSLSERADARKANAEGKPVEFFGGSALLAFTYATADESRGVATVGYYSGDLFENVSGVQQSQARQPSLPAAGGESNGSPSNGGSCFARDPGMASTNRADHYGWAQRQNPATLDEKLAVKINLLFTCSLTRDQLSNAFADLSVIIARNVRNAGCFAGDRGVLTEDWSAHKEFAGNTSPGDLLNNLRWKAGEAFKCLNRVGKISLFADGSVALAKAALGGGGGAHD